MPHTLMNKLWYTRHPLRWFLWPAALLYRMITAVRRVYLLQFAQQCFPVPIIVVGNLTVGGVGKTPLVIELARQLQARGVRVGIVSRGYGSRLDHYPHEVSPDEDAANVGDEPLLLAKKTGCPVVIAPKRTDAVQYLLDKHQCQMIISDDGLQHYAMGRAIEIVVIDGVRGFGNGLCLPAGPLRESPSRLQRVDFVVVNGAASRDSAYYHMDLLPGKITQLVSGQQITLDELTPPIAAVAAIGYPERFFATLKALGVVFNAYPFADHHRFRADELLFAEKTVVMTEKDAVKCLPFATESMYFLPVEAKVDDTFFDTLYEKLQGCL
jgi:tetraacyldisaccharide 4'-kinase